MSDPFIFKVMRLPSPSFRLVSSCAAAIDGGHGDALTSLLQVSNSIGTVYCGEVFRCAVCAIANPPNNVAYESVVIRCELHTTSARSPCGECAADTMSVGDKRELNVEHALTESGINCLVAHVSFNVADGATSDRRAFQKFFKFNVFDAVNIAATARAYDQRIVLECSISNNSHKTIQVYAVSLLPTRIGTSTRSVSGIGSGGKSGAIQLSAGASLNALFDVDDHGDTDVGRVHVKWRSLIGECGKVKSAPIQRPNARAPASRDFEWTVVRAPATAVIEEPFDVAIRIRHTATAPLPSPLSVRVSFLRERLGQVVPFGAAQAESNFSADAAADVVLSVLPIQVGVQKIGGLRIALTANGVPTSAVDIDTLHFVDVRPATKR